MEITCLLGKLSIHAQQHIKISTTLGIEIKTGGELKLQGSSTAKITAGSPSDFDASTIEIGG
jgi:hypothetical protein